jgi:hypothetical protein
VNVAALLIGYLWRYAKSLWNFRNTIVHGATVEEQARKAITTLHEKVTGLYEDFNCNPDMVLSWHQELFTSRPLAQCLRSSYDTLSAWVRSVEEAIQVLNFQTERLREEAGPYFHDYDATEDESDSS